MKKKLIKCKICKNNAFLYEKIKVLKKYWGELYRCNKCEFMFVHKPHWLAEAYRSPIHPTDTGYVWRNLRACEVVKKILIENRIEKHRFLDYAAGYGLFVRLMRDEGFDFKWYDPICQNLFAIGFEDKLYKRKTFKVITAFEVLEHLENPVPILKKILQATDLFIFSTILIPTPTPKVKDWWYFCFEDSGQHIAFFSKKTLQKIASDLQIFYSTNNFDLHIFSKQKMQIEKKQSGIVNTIKTRLKLFRAQRVQNEKLEHIMNDREKVLKCIGKQQTFKTDKK